MEPPDPQQATLLALGSRRPYGRIPDCHPEAKHQAKGLCRPCYQKYAHQLRMANSVWAEKKKAKAREFRARNPERVRESARKTYFFTKYGITVAERQAILERQDGRCANAGCRRILTRGGHLDHDHDSGVVRGILCPQCNRALGLLGEDPRRTAGLIAYLCPPRS